MSTTKPQTLNFQFIFEMSIIFTLNTSEMRVIFVVLISSIFALYPPNMSFLRELFRNLPSSGRYFKTLQLNYPIRLRTSLRYSVESNRDAERISCCQTHWISEGDFAKLKKTQKVFRNEDINHQKI